ncbi:TATA-binding protein associated factor Taf2 [Armillaria luteobubalina]|uniref:Transcription initiation factor TFIID subunit 2 n=1 Tax=Armillaria luteobubalina TaxID=153913 RepID=A0AA39UVZ6_9AGAR|nr:TATA-binding protein associated factor Taf2 [Armillaria luteobubalina]
MDNRSREQSRRDCHRHLELKRKLYSALQEGDDGELAIGIPRDVSLKYSGTATPEPQTPGVSQAQNGHTAPEFSSIVVKISYSLRNPVDGFEFVLPDDSHPHRVPHAYTTPSCPDASRCWVPCADSVNDKCTWEFEFVVPRYLEELDPLQDEEANDLSPTLVVCSGELVEQVAHPYNSNKTIFIFSQAVLTSVQHIAFAAGPFHILTIPPEGMSDDTTTTSQQPGMYAFCLPGQEAYLSTSTSALRSAMTFYATEFGSYPFGSYKVVFVDELPVERFDSSTLCLVTVDLLHGDDAIEQAIEVRQILSHALACQWAGINIQPKTWSDIWLVNGLALYINGLFLRKLFGNNEDNGTMPPICQPQVLDPPDSSVLPFINLKAPLVLHILDRRLGKSGTSLGLSRVLPKVFLSAISGEMPNNMLSTHAFLRTCRKVSGVDLRGFAEQWIYGSGCPAFGVSATFNRKKMAVEITMRQESPAYKVHENSEVHKQMLKPVPFFEGTMTIRIHEADGTPYEHVLDIRSPFKRYEVPFNTKYKRVRRNTKRYLARQAAAQAAAEGDTEAAEAMGMVDMGFGLDIWEKEKERENWKVADWTEEDEGLMSGATYEWIRMDADFEWIANLNLNSLISCGDVVAQLEAVHALAKQPTAIVSSTLTKTVLVSNYHYRIRTEAASALVNCAIRRLDFLGLFHLFKLFLRYCYEPEDPNQDLFSHTYVPKPNEFSDLSEYFVRKTLITAISRIRFENGKSPSVVRQFLIDQLKYNDNTVNLYSDGFYICTIISAAACATISMAAPERGELLPTEVRSEHNAEDQQLLKGIVAEVDRYRSMDRLIPSAHNIVTIAALEFYMVLGVANLIPNNQAVFFLTARDGNYTPVRIAAFDGLFLTKCLALLVQMGELKSSSKDNDTLLIEEDGNNPEKTKEDREVGKNEVLREFLMAIALAPDVDHEVRWCILKLADLLIRPVDEVPPKLSLHLPPKTPIIETPPSLPVPKVSIKPQRKSSVVANVKSPLAPVHMPPKLKLSNGGITRDLTLKPPPPPQSIAPVSPPKKTGSFTVPPPSVKGKPKGRPPNKNPKRTQVPKAYSSGMSLSDLTVTRNALKKIRDHKHARWFLQPVDPVRDKALNYFDIIKEPMDLGTMGARLEAGLYKDRFAFRDDFRVMIANAKHYNMPGSPVHDAAIALELSFEKMWSLMSRTLEAADDKARVAAAAAASAAVPLPPKSRPPVPTPKFSPPPPSVRDHAPRSATPATESISRPTIKLRVASQPKADEPPKRREVLAIEREKDEQKQRSAQAKSATISAPNKRKALSDEADDILALASPSKKEKPTPIAVAPTPSGSSSTRIVVPASHKPIPVKPKKDKVEAPSAPRPSAKGKEKEVLPIPEASSSKTKRPAGEQTSTPLNQKKVKALLMAIKLLPEARIFNRPVDPILDGCPSYLEEIAHPMDFGTMSEKLTQNQYQTMEGFRADFELVISNCRQFNPIKTYPHDCAAVLEKYFRKEWPKLVERKLSFAEKRGLLGVMTSIVKDNVSWIFREPVDPELLGIPTYFQVIPRKDARDLRTIRTKLEADKYDTVEAFEADIALMIHNAITFNGLDSEVGPLAIACRDKIQSLINAWRTSQDKKRKDVEKGSSQPSKKAKLG